MNLLVSFSTWVSGQPVPTLSHTKPAPGSIPDKYHGVDAMGVVGGAWRVMAGGLNSGHEREGRGPGGD